MSHVISKIKLAISMQGLETRIDASRVVMSSQYDLDYQITTLGLVLHLFKGGRSRSSPSAVQMNRMLLRLVHFLALRSDMIPEFKYWYAENMSKHSPSLDDWTTFPVGFMSDSTQNDTIDLLLIRHELIEDGKDIILQKTAPSRINKLTMLALKVGLFAGEVSAINALSALKMQLKVLGF